MSNNGRLDQLAIIADILQITKENTLKTQIMYKANLSYTQLNTYLGVLIKNDLIIQTNNAGPKQAITPTGTTRKPHTFVSIA